MIACVPVYQEVHGGNEQRNGHTIPLEEGHQGYLIGDAHDAGMTG
jgi:hypothetical protein